MNIRRKIQLSATGVVVVNGLLALAMMSPGLALANPCAPINYVASPAGVCGNAQVVCQNLAPAGCTVTSATCTFLPPSAAIFSCRYD